MIKTKLHLSLTYNIALEFVLLMIDPIFNLLNLNLNYHENIYDIN